MRSCRVRAIGRGFYAMQYNEFPPVRWLWEQYRVNAAWYSGDPAELRRSTNGFWRSPEGEKVHVPIAAELANVAVGFLFSDSPTITHENEETSTRLEIINSKNGMYSRLIEAAELQSVYGGVFLKWNWDKARSDVPMFRVVPADSGMPHYVNGSLAEIDFWAVVRYDDQASAYWRLCETYNRDGRIVSKLFKGTSDMIGEERSLEELPETADINREVQSGTGMLLATYIPARLPNREHPYSPYGRSDFEGLHTLFSALDEAYSSMMRDVRLGKTQIIVPAEFLEKSVRDLMFSKNGENKLDKTPNWVYNKANEAYVALNYSPDNEGSNNITTFQPEIRAEDHEKVIDGIMRKIVTLAGYSPQSLGLDVEGQAESGTALSIRERRSIQTAEVRKTYWWQGLLHMMRAGLALDKAVYSPGLVIEGDISIEFADNTQPDMQTMADTLDKLNRAGAVSTEQKVRMLHPDWDDSKVEEEVAAIDNASGLLPPVDDGLGDMENDAE